MDLLGRGRRDLDGVCLAVDLGWRVGSEKAFSGGGVWCSNANGDISPL